MSQTLFLLHNIDDIKPLLPKIEKSSGEKTFFIFHASLAQADIETLRLHGNVLQEQDFLTYPERQKLDQRILDFIETLGPSHATSAVLNTIPLSVPLIQNIRTLCTFFFKLTHTLPVLLDRIQPQHIVATQPDAFFADTLESIMEPYTYTTLTYSPRGPKRKHLWCTRLSSCLKLFRWFVKSFHKKTNERLLAKSKNILLFCNISNDLFDDVMTTCSEKGQTPLTIGNKSSYWKKHKKKAVLFESFYWQNLKWKRLFKIPTLKIPDKIYAPLKNAINQLYAQRGLEVSAHLAACQKLLATYDIRLIFVWNDNLWWERSLLSLANQKDIPSFLFQHGFWSVIGLHASLLANKVGCWGAFSQQQLIERHYEKSRLTPVGHPKYVKNERPRPLSEREQNNTFLFVGLPMPQHRIYTPHVYYEETRRLLECVASACQKQDCSLLIKARTSSDIKRYKKWLAKINHNPRKIEFKMDPIHTLVGDCLGAIAYDSTAILDAFMTNTPTILVDLHHRYNMKDRHIFCQKKALLLAHDENAIEHHINALLNHYDETLEKLLPGMKLCRDHYLNLEHTSTPATLIAQELEQLSLRPPKSP